MSWSNRSASLRAEGSQILSGLCVKAFIHRVFPQCQQICVCWDDREGWLMDVCMSGQTQVEESAPCCQLGDFAEIWKEGRMLSPYARLPWNLSSVSSWAWAGGHWPASITLEREMRTVALLALQPVTCLLLNFFWPSLCFSLSWLFIFILVKKLEIKVDFTTFPFRDSLPITMPGIMMVVGLGAGVP